mmetsp:Transcript_647/g.1168  ORF Transcript_647/g.1168 Transcript_647/m.1168 type:complete len:298 (+) Transcript_647:98-991(+)|eukprot:CAMPEP_0198206800 /NCGR_PEP_ID=MMETSP1445-20131203/10338_1 /TAXON_ID=36898 /ORGANISM="Pyramimonas sp., Strain CCMP2087" /LENGTH=297 /DNA_ID=CAMNT_0043879641 /DNA_START=74 /DNA_END=967 /DNA_ORIENTATION=-
MVQAPVKFGPKGLPYPVWKPEYEQERMKAAIENAALLATPTDGSCEPAAGWSDSHEYNESAYWRGRYKAGVVDNWYCPASVIVPLLPKPAMPTETNRDRMLAEMMGTNEPEGAATLSSAERMLAELSVSKERPTAPSTHRASSALVVGEVTSDLAEQLLQAGYGEVVCVDVVEEAMAELAIKHAAEARLRFATLDVTNLAPLEANSFDLVVEKGVIDSLVCGDDSNHRTAMAVSEIQRVTKVGGCFVSVSHSNDRAHSLKQCFGANIKGSRCVYDIKKSGDPETDGIVFFKYVCTKQ